MQNAIYNHEPACARQVPHCITTTAASVCFGRRMRGPSAGQSEAIALMATSNRRAHPSGLLGCLKAIDIFGLSLAPARTSVLMEAAMTNVHDQHEHAYALRDITRRTLTAFRDLQQTQKPPPKESDTDETPVASVPAGGCLTSFWLWFCAHPDPLGGPALLGPPFCPSCAPIASLALRWALSPPGYASPQSAPGWSSAEPPLTSINLRAAQLVCRIRHQ